MTDWSAERLARAVLSQVCEPGDPRLTRLVAGHGAVAAVEALRRGGAQSAWGLRAMAVDEAEIVARAERLNLRYVIPTDQEWPHALADLGHCEPVGGMG
ncbi:MAG: DNA-processing protein DprA, partial [Brooklawnia sp.]